MRCDSCGCAQRPENRDTGNEKRAKVCPTSGKQGHWERKGGKSVPGVRKNGTLGTRRGREKERGDKTIGRKREHLTQIQKNDEKDFLLGNDGRGGAGILQ